LSKKKKLPPTGRMERRMWRSEQVARTEAIKPKKRNKNACRKNKGRQNREEH
jgi:hypothetical protein